ncbi:MAG: tyrosine-type recombinase/integrase [Pseudonocardiaceae bacterium]
MDVLYGVRMVGPLTPYARGFAGELARLGFTTFSARGQLGLAVQLSRWLAGAGLDATALTTVTVDAFLVARRAAGYTAYLTPKALAPLLGYLRGLGVTPRPGVAVPATRAEELVERYRGYLLVERGLQVKAARGYVDLVRPFIAGRVSADGVELEALTSSEVSAFLVASSRRLAPKTTQRLATALRSLLRFWHLEGLIRRPLAQSVPKVANRRAGLVRALEPEQVAAMLSGCERDSVAGRRDLAILTLLARMGLRAGEVAGLRLDDIDWRRAEITIRGKGSRRDQLPLPVDVGHTVAGYLRHGRPVTALDRSVFIRVKAPHRGLTSTGVTQVVAAAARRAGLGTVYAHRLRHSAATSMLVHGASLAEIGQVLRHRRGLTTALYAQVDTEALRALARPWPGVS